MIDYLAELPVVWANAISGVLLLAIAGACFRVPKKTVIADAPSGAPWRDLRWWALALIGLQLGLYALFS